jgi:hypothetical protein
MVLQCRRREDSRPSGGLKPSNGWSNSSMNALKALSVATVVFASMVPVLAQQTARHGMRAQPIAAVRKAPRSTVPVQSINRYPVDDIRNVNPYFYKGPCWSGGCAPG